MGTHSYVVNPFEGLASSVTVSGAVLVAHADAGRWTLSGRTKAGGPSTSTVTVQGSNSTALTSASVPNGSWSALSDLGTAVWAAGPAGAIRVFEAPVRWVRCFRSNASIDLLLHLRETTG